MVQGKAHNPCRYTSGTFKNAEINYHINEKEVLAIKNSIRKFMIFLLPKKFTVYTDSTVAKGLIKLPRLLEYKRLIRWQTSFSHYNFNIVHIKGDTNYLADLLTREGA